MSWGWTQASTTPPPLDRLLIKAKRALENVQTTINVLSERPAEITVELPSGQIVRAYVNITFKNAAPEHIELGHMTFKLEKEWLSENSVHKWAVALNRYDPELGQWISMPVKKVNEDDTYVYYTASITHFSTFAISGSQTLPPLDFKVDSLSISPITIESGEVVNVSARVTNLSERTGTYVTTLWINNTVETGQDVYLQAGEAKSVSFTVTREAEGSYKVRVDRLTGNFSVTEVIEPTPTPTPTPTPAPTPTPTPTSGVPEWWQNATTSVGDWWSDVITNVGGWWDNLSGNISG
ncbi:PGF-pre-PGF domain-containing protein [Chloroflexota bacterium]